MDEKKSPQTLHEASSEFNRATDDLMYELLQLIEPVLISILNFLTAVADLICGREEDKDKKK